MDLYIQVHARGFLPSAVPWISEDRLLYGEFVGHGTVDLLTLCSENADYLRTKVSNLLDNKLFELDPAIPGSVTLNFIKYLEEFEGKCQNQVFTF